ncbi:MAG: serine/threonine protein kinase [Myxococcales bacterium]|nr:serine/threonine protein kinase [Myxococcales bacterium]MCB9566485.1 serine/threonine protein kinase [Myxococcales bacterium]MCB9705664.1 serine/threonine protein kinase [Myxococcales bacterium]
MEAIVLLIIFGSIFGSIVANRVLKYRHIERMRELEQGQGPRALQQGEVLALQAAKAELEERVRHLETIVCNVDFELNAKLNRLATRHLALEAALPSAPSIQAASQERVAETERVLAGTVRPGLLVAGRFEIIRLLGAGGMGAVYLARDLQLKEEVALKVVAGLGLSDPASTERLRREAAAARRISHKNVVRLHDIGEEGGLLFLSMEFVDGESLHQRLTRVGPLSGAELRPLLAQLCDGLQAAHAAGVIHRDLKPANILIDRQGQVKLIDFGIARMAHTDGMTATGMVIGTAEYMAPEQIRGGAVDARTDLYALGVIIYEALTGRPPFSGETPIAVGLAHVTEPVPAPRTIRADVSPAWEALILRALAKSPTMRFQSASELRSALPIGADDPTQPSLELSQIAPTDRIQ